MKPAERDVMLFPYFAVPFEISASHLPLSDGIFACLAKCHATTQLLVRTRDDKLGWAGPQWPEIRGMMCLLGAGRQAACCITIFSPVALRRGRDGLNEGDLSGRFFLLRRPERA